jgi:hypothetical protein
LHHLNSLTYEQHESEDCFSLYGFTESEARGRSDGATSLTLHKTFIDRLPMFFFAEVSKQMAPIEAAYSAASEFVTFRTGLSI